MAELSTSKTLAQTFRSVWHRQAPRLSWRALFLLWIPSILVSLSLILPIAYLVVRVFGSDHSFLDLVFQMRNLVILGRTIGLAVSVTLASIFISIPLAWLTVRTDLPLRRLWAILSALPLVIPSYVGAYLLVSALGPRGIIQGWLQGLFGIERLPSIYGFPGALLVLTLISYPYIFLSLRASLMGMDPALEEAARSLGHDSWKTFWRVTIPQMRPGLVAGSLLVILYVFRDFGAVSVMRYTTFTRAIYVQYQSAFDRSGAAALALVLIAMTLIILILEHSSRNIKRYYNSTSAPVRIPVTISLGKWRWGAILFCGLVVGLGLVIPAGVLLYWLVRGIQAGEQVTSLWFALRNSLSASFLAAAATLAASLPIAILSVRYPGRLSGILARMTYIGFALPGVAIALSLVFFGANYALVLYQTLPLLIFAYLVLFIPQSVGAVQTSLIQINPNLEEAGRSLGKSPLKVFKRVTLPLVRPGLGVGAALVFLTTMKELPATLILGPFGFKTLATSIWSAVSEAFFAKAAAPALVLILVSSIPMAFFVVKNRLR